MYHVRELSGHREHKIVIKHGDLLIADEDIRN